MIYSDSHRCLFLHESPTRSDRSKSNTGTPKCRKAAAIANPECPPPTLEKERSREKKHSQTRAREGSRETKEVANAYSLMMATGEVSQR